MVSTEIAIPAERVRFSGGYALRGRRRGEPIWRHRVTIGLPEPLPKNTMDPRYPWCAEHRTACVCREAELAEQISEYRHELNGVIAAAAEVLAGHRTFPDSYSREFVRWDHDASGRLFQVWHYEYDEAACCSCTGCVLVRKAHISQFDIERAKQGGARR